MHKFAVAAVAAAFVMGAGTASAALAKAPARGMAKASSYRPARLSDGHPDLNGVWQVMNAANWDIEPHAARAALQMRPGPVVPVPAKEIVALGAVGSVPGGAGVVIGGTIPYTPEALKRREENRAHYLERDPEVKCYLPGIPRANYMDHPFQILQSTSQMLFTYEYDSAGAQHAVQGSRPRADRFVDGPVGGALGG